ncbi:MAG: RDD family protein [Pirellulaceae bacterium]
MSSASSAIDTTVDIVTPENIAFHYQVAGPFRRFPAYLIDVCIQIAILFGLAIVASLLSFGLGTVSLAVWILAEFTLSWFYGGLFETYWNGQTPGKRILGIRVLTAQGRPVNGYQAVLRNIMRTVDMGPLISAELFGGPAVPLIPTYALGLGVMATNRRFQRLGDLVCKTMVVVEDRPWLSGIAKIEDPRAFELASYLPADLQVSRSMARALAHYAERRKYFSPSRRREVAKHLARPLLLQFGLPDNTSYDLLLCAMYYRLFIADRGADESHAARARAAVVQKVGRA